jgi:hypothetical protein
MIGGSIIKYAVRDPYITGYAEPKISDLEFNPRTPPGYFLVDTKTHLKRAGMSGGEWLTALKAIGWRSPKLQTPP